MILIFASHSPFETGRVRQPPPVPDGDGLLPDVDRSVVVLEQPPRVVLSSGHLVELSDTETTKVELVALPYLINPLHLSLLYYQRSDG